MPHHNIVFHDLLKQVPWATFERLVAQHGGDDGERGFTSKAHLIALLYGQFAGAGSLREIIGGLNSQADRLYHLGGRVTKRSTLAEANATRPSALFADLLGALIHTAHRRLRRDLRACVHLIDATTIRLTQASAGWARFGAGVCGVKVHAIYDPAADCPLYAQVSASRVNDITVAQSMPVQPGATYVFDLGYYDYAWWAALHQQGCRIVTRFKSNTPLTVSEERPVPEGGAILSDRIGSLPKRQAKNRKNPFQVPVREVRVRIETGKVLRVLSNDLSASAQEIADLYKRRWAIELFWRWIKQTLKIRRFLGTSETAVRTQVAVALIAFLLLRLARQAFTRDQTDPPPGELEFARLVRVNLMQPRRIDQLHRPYRRPPANSNQMEFQWAAA